MGIGDFFTGGVRELMVARPDAAKDQVIFKHPDPTIPYGAQLTVDSDEVALFFRDGLIVGLIRPGLHTLLSNNIPFLSSLIDRFTGGNVLQAEIFFVTTREVAEQKFGGRVGAIEDPKSGVPVEMMVHGTYSLRVTDPQRLLLGLVGMRSVENDAFMNWFRELILKVIREQIAQLLVQQRWPILDVTSGAYTSEIEKTVIAGSISSMAAYGLSLVRLGNFVVGIREKDAQSLKQLYVDAAYVRMSGGIQQYQAFAAGRAMMGAGQGMSDGGGGGSALLGGAGLGVGFGLAGVMGQNVGGMAPSGGGGGFFGMAPGGASAPADAGSSGGSRPAPRYYLHLGGRQLGPFDRASLRQRVADGTFTTSTPVWTDGMADWQQAGTLPELQELFASPADGPPPFGGNTGPPPFRG